MTSTRPMTFALAALVGAVAPAPVSALQETVRATGPSVGEIAVERILTIGERDGPSYVPGIGSVSRDARGRYVGWFVHEPHLIRVYDSDGQLVETIGRRGEGPGEYQFIWEVIHGPGDTLFVLDTGSRRITTLAPDRSVERTAPLPISSLSGLSAIMGDGRFVVHSRIATEDRAGYPLHVLDSEGRIERSFGADPPILRRDRPHLGRRVVAPSRQGTWSAHVARYRVELWTPDAELRRVIDREVDWFTPYDEQDTAARPPNAPPRPRIHAIHEDAEGLLWVAILVPAESWQEAVRETIAPGGQPVSTVVDPSRYQNMLVEVIDPDTGAVLGSTRFTETHFMFLDGNQAVTYREDAVGYPFLDVWRMTPSVSSGAG